MDIGGPDWSGWSFSPYGRARSWRLIAPDGSNFTAAEVASIPQLALDLDYLRLQVSRLQAEHQAAAVYLTPDDAAALRTAAEILRRIASPYRRGSRSTGTGPTLVELAAPHQYKHPPTKKAGGI